MSAGRRNEMGLPEGGTYIRPEGGDVNNIGRIVRTLRPDAGGLETRRSGDRLENQALNDVEERAAVAPALFADVGRRGGDHHHVETGDHKDILAAVSPRETGLVAGEIPHPPAVPVFPVP